MPSKKRTPRKIVKKMYQDYKNWKPVVKIAKDYGLSRNGVYFLFDREDFPRDRMK